MKNRQTGLIHRNRVFGGLAADGIIQRVYFGSYPDMGVASGSFSGLPENGSVYSQQEIPGDSQYPQSPHKQEKENADCCNKEYDT